MTQTGSAMKNQVPQLGCGLIFCKAMMFCGEATDVGGKCNTKNESFGKVGVGWKIAQKRLNRRLNSALGGAFQRDILLT